MEEVDVCNSWEDIDPTALEKRLEKITLDKTKTEEAQRFKILTRQQDPRNDNLSHQVQLDDTSQESLRSQYVPPEPKISILSRPKASSGGASNSQQLNGHASNKNKPVKTLQQREQEYAEARLRILGNVKFEDSDECEVEEDAASFVGLTPAEILKQKIAQVLLEDNPSGSPKASQESQSLPPTTKTTANTTSPTTAATAPAPKSSKKSKREKIKTTNPEPTRDFPVSKTDMERIIRQPRGPDGTSGFNFQR